MTKNNQQTKRDPFYLILGGVIVAVIISLFIWGAVSNNDTSTKDNVYTINSQLGVDNLEIQDGSVQIGQKAAIVNTTDFNNNPITLGGPTAKPTALIFAAHWCPHCNKELPEITEWAKEGKNSDVNIIAISTSVREGAQNYPPQTWLEEMKWPYDIALDNQLNDISNAYGVQGFPYFVFLDTQGVISNTASGEIGINKFEEYLDELEN